MTTECFYCQTPTTTTKREVVWTEQEQADGTVQETGSIDQYPCCQACEDENFDGTETYPGVA